MAEKEAILVIDVQNCFLPATDTYKIPGLPTVNSRNKAPYGASGLAIGICNFIELKPNATVFISKDFHPEGHKSFGTTEKPAFSVNANAYKNWAQTENNAKLEKITRHWGDDAGRMAQMLWPPHCIQGTDDSSLAPELDACLEGRSTETILKGFDPRIDSYSAVADALGYVTPYMEADNTKFLDRLRNSDIEHIYVAGIARNVCVFSTVMDLLNAWVLPAFEKGESKKVHLLYNLTRPVNPQYTKSRAEFITDVQGLLDTYFEGKNTKPNIDDVFVIDEDLGGYEKQVNVSGGRRRCRRRRTHRHCKCKKRSCKRCNSHNSRKSRKNRR